MSEKISLPYFTFDRQTDGQNIDRIDAHIYMRGMCTGKKYNSISIMGRENRVFP